jgi:hypothetical protein
MRRSTALLLALAWILTGSPARSDESLEEATLLRCGVETSARAVRDRARELADYLGSAHGGSHPAAVALATSMAGVSAALDSQLGAIAPAYGSFTEAWQAFDESVRQSPLPRDPALRPVLPGYQKSVAQLEGLLGCVAPANDTQLVPCLAVPVAHLLAVVSEQIHQYLGPRYGESLTPQVEAAAELERTARDLHHVLHDLEVAVPGAQLSFEALEASFAGSSLTDTDDPDDLAVKTRLDAVRQAVADFAGYADRCHDPAAEHESHEGR